MKAVHHLSLYSHETGKNSVRTLKKPGKQICHALKGFQTKGSKRLLFSLYCRGVLGRSMLIELIL